MMRPAASISARSRSSVFCERWPQTGKCWFDGYAKAGGHYAETVIADSGHGPHLDQPREFGAALLAHLVNAAAV